MDAGTRATPKTRATTASRRAVIAAVDELDAIDEVLRSLPSVRRLVAPLPDSTERSRATGRNGGAGTPADSELGGLEEGILELIRARLQEVAATLRSIHESGTKVKGGAP